MTKPLSIRWTPKDALDGMQMLDAMEELAYRRILDLIYVTDDGLVDDDKKLAWMTKTGKQWKRIKASLIAFGKITVIDSKIRNDKCTETILETRKYIEQKRSAGKSSSENRKPLENKDTASTVVATDASTEAIAGAATTIPVSLGVKTQPSLLASSLSSEGKEPSSDKPPLPPWLPVPEWESFVEMRKKIPRCPFTDRAKTLALRRLDELREQGYGPVEVINAAVLNSWKTFYPPKDDYGNRNPQPTSVEKRLTALYRAGAELGEGERMESDAGGGETGFEPEFKAGAAS